MNDILASVEKYSNVIEGSWDRRSGTSMSTHSYLEIGMVNITLSTMWAGDFKPASYVCRLDGEVDIDLQGVEAYATLQKYYKTPKVEHYPDIEAMMSKTEKGSYAASAGPLVDNNPAYDGVRMTVWEYDINSAYATELMNRIPNLRASRTFDWVKPGEIGFFIDDELSLVPPGYYADVVMPLMDSPYKEFAWKYYKKKQEGDVRAKSMLNLAIGYLQRTNPFIRSYIVHRCNDRIKLLIDSNTVMWNTDAIYSIVRRPDLDIGDGIGQWKEKKIENFAKRGNVYQEGYGLPHYRGIPRKWFKDWDILRDSPPKIGNSWQYNKETNRIEEVEWQSL